MDKVIKINSKEGGPFTTTSNLINFDIMPDGAYDFTDSYVNLVCSITGVTDATPATGQGVYNPLINYTDKITANVDDCKVRSLYNVAMVKNCSMTSELQGSLEDIRRVDILRQNLNEYTLTTDEKQSLEYQSLRQLTPRNYLRNSTFRELHNEGTAPSRNVQSRIRIPMSQLFELGKLTAYPAQKMGKTRIHLEMNLDKFAISANLGIPKGSTTFAQFDIVTAPASGVDVNSLTSKDGVTYIDKTDSPYYVGQKVEVKFSTDVDAGGGADAVGEIPTASATGVGTVTAGADAELQSGGARILVLSSVNASDNAKKITIVGTDINDQSLTATETAANGDFGTHLFKTVSSINLFATDGTTPAQATATIEINAKAGGAQITATRIISAIAYDDATKKQTLTFNSNLVTGLPASKVLTVVPVEINTGSLPDEANNVGVLPVKPNSADPATGVITGAKLQVDMAEIVLRKLGAVPKMPAQLNYMSWSTEEFNGNGQTNFQRMFQLEPNAVNVFMMFPSNDLFSVKDGFDNYRLRLGGPGGNQDLTDRDVIVGGALGKQKDPLYYDRLSMTMLNAGYPMKSMLEQNMNVVVAEVANDNARRDDAGNLTIVANPVPATPYEKLLQVNMNFAANKGLTELALFKQVMRGVAL